MELTHQNTSLLEDLIIVPKIDTSFPNEFLQNNWNFTQLEYQTPDLHFPVTNPSFLELNYPNCPFGEFQPFLDALTSQDQFGSIYELPIQEDMFLDNCINGFDVADATPNMDRTINVDDLYGHKKSKSKKPDGQPSKNLMAERRRRKRLNDRLSMLRSIVPKISKMDRTSILGDTIDYTRELLDKIRKLQEGGMEDGNDQIDLIASSYMKKDVKPNEMQLRNPPKFDVERRSKDTLVEVCCTSKPGLLLSTLSTLDVLGLDIQQCVISCFNDFSLQASCYEAPEQRSILCSEDVKQALFRNAGYGGRCP